ncbi:glutathione S-transferase [Salmonella enterica]|nr:glutathione S-transferase [Salmonella enterica]
MTFPVPVIDDAERTVTNGAIVIHTQRLKSDPGGNLLS